MTIAVLWRFQADGHARFSVFYITRHDGLPGRHLSSTTNKSMQSGMAWRQRSHSFGPLSDQSWFGGRIFG